MDSYRQAIKAIGLSIERLTSGVPNDGWFYVLKDGELVGRFRNLKSAQVRYKELVAASGWIPAPAQRDRPDPSVEAVERYMDELTDYWGSAHQHRRPGVKRA